MRQRIARVLAEWRLLRPSIPSWKWLYRPALPSGWRMPTLPSSGRLKPLLDRIHAYVARRSFLSRRRLFVGGIALLGILVVLLGGFAWNTSRAAAAVQRDIADILDTVGGEFVRELTSPEEYAELVREVGEVERELSDLRTRLAVLQWLRWLPGIGSRIGDAMLLLGMGDHFARGTLLTLEGYRGVATALNPNTSPEVIAALAETLKGAAPLFIEAQGELAEARRLSTQIGDTAALGSTALRAQERVNEFLPLIEAVALVGAEAPQLIADVVELRRVIQELRGSLSEPTALLERPEEFQALFAEVQVRAASIESGLIQVRSSMRDDDPRLIDSVDTALQASALLRNLGGGLARLAAVSQEAFKRGLLTREAGDLLGEELPATQEIMEEAEQQIAQLRDKLSAGGEETGLMTLMSGLLGSSAWPLQREESLLRTGRNLVDFWYYSLGYEEPRRYLLLGQNDDEIRASGGFIGVVVEVTVERGELVQLLYLDSTAVDGPLYTVNPPAPEPIFRYLWIGKLLFRDANWNPHFPSAASQLADIYQRAQGVRVDGVLAMTEEVILDMVDAFGGIRVPEVQELLDRDQAERYVEGELLYVCQPRHGSTRPKRCFDEDLFQATLQRITSSLSQGEQTRVMAIIPGRLARKDILMHLFDPDASEILWEQGWNGTLTQVDHDYLMVVDSAVPGHVRKVVERRLSYQVSLGVGQPLEAELLVEYRHRGGEPDPNCRQAVPTETGCFWNYLRVYIPVLATAIQAPPVPVHEGSEWLVWGYTPADSRSVISAPREGQVGLTEIGGYLTVEPGTTLTLPLRYTLPANMVRQIGPSVYQYRLLIQKQPGTPVEPVSVFVELPEGATLVSTFLPPTGQTGQWVRLDLSLAGDETVVVDFRMP